MSLEEENEILMHEYDLRFHCVDCGNISGKEGIDILLQSGKYKYICKECRGRCVPETELGKVKGVKSIRQKFRKGHVGLSLFVISAIMLIINFYDHQVVARDYRNYLLASQSTRSTIESHLKTFWMDHKIIEGGEEVDLKEVGNAGERIRNAKKAILYRAGQIENVKKPETDEIMAFHIIEAEFFRNPSYDNFIRYRGMFNQLKHKYNNFYIEVLRKKIKSLHEREKT